MIIKEGLGSLTGICSHKQIGLEMSLEGGDGGEPSNVSRQVIHACGAAMKGSRSEGV